MTETVEVVLEWTRVGSRGEVALKAVFPDGSTHTEKIDVLKDSAKQKYLDRLLEAHSGISREAVAERLERIAAETADLSGEAGSGDDNEASLLLDIASGDRVDLFHTPGGHDTDAYATIEFDGHRETWAVQSRGFKRWLLSEFFDQYGKAPNDQALRSAIATIDAKAIFRGSEHDVFVRVAGVGDVVWLDLGDSAWRAVRVDRDGYTVVDSECVEVRFTRPAGLLPLPVPEDGGSLDLLRDLVNIGSDDDWVLLVGWLVMALHPSGDHPILAVNGEEGSAKTTLCRFARGTIDPNVADLRRPPREELDLVIAAKNSWIVGFDNFSGLSERLSDAICCLSTGSAFSTRTLYTTQDETLIAVKRPSILNGIPDLLTRGDLASRSIRLTLEAIGPTKRRRRRDVERRFEKIHPGVLGALLGGVACALRRQDDVHLPGLTRMADLCVWVSAAEPALGLEPGSFVAAYERRIAESVHSVIESSAIGGALLSLLDGREETWVGTPTELLAALEQRRGTGRRPRGWPDSAQKTSNEIRRIAPSLRKKGIEVIEPKKGSNPRLFRIGPLPGASTDVADVTMRAQARASAGDTPPDRHEEAASRAPALPALDSEPPVVGDEPGVDDRDLGFGWVD